MNYVRHIILVVAIALACGGPALPARADNYGQSHRVMVCSWVFEGHAHSIDMGDLDATMSAKEKAAFETVMLNDSMREMAGLYHKEYADYGSVPASVTRADMVGWHCTWTER